MFQHEILQAEHLAASPKQRLHIPSSNIFNVPSNNKTIQKFNIISLRDYQHYYEDNFTSQFTNSEFTLLATNNLSLITCEAHYSCFLC